jgi:hypothetical protein
VNLRTGIRIALFTVLAAVVALAPGRALGQTADALPGAGWKPATSTVTLPRTPWGDPDISGMYEPGHIQQPAEVPIGDLWTKPQGPAQPTDFGARDQAYSDSTRKQIPLSKKPFVVDPPDGKIPMQPWVFEMRKKIYENHYTDKVEYLDPRIRCLQAGVPRAHTPVYYNSYQILQRPGAVIIVYEWNHMTRIIPLDGRPHLDSRIRLPMCDARGHWEGNVLVVETTNFTDDTWVLGHGAGPRDGQPAETASTGHGLVHSDQYRVVERFVPIDGDIIHYEATIDDPKAFTRPFTISFDAMVRGRPDHQIFEYACHEGNRDGMLLMTGFDIDQPQAKK